MKVTKAEFARTVAVLTQLPRDERPQVAFAGRSNVGKSSLINCLVGRRKLALVSSTPGKTRHLNFYLINDAVYFVDLPGYGFAQVSRQAREQWGELVTAYLEGCAALRGVVLITDARHELSPLDLQTVAWLQKLRLPTVVVATKSDKLSRSQLLQQQARNGQLLAPLGVDELISFSARTGHGKHQLWARIDALLAAPPRG
ncbi:MAG: YihA family ribosome biogenesis GTP-binding protein [Calditrichaeota bacterium]|nr:YihA family ribosome biogenesis GTP-binding protein [Calditrichota bacterium]